MTLPSSGSLSINDIKGEFGGPASPSLTDYYAGGTYVASGTEGDGGPIPTSGTIKITDFYGASATLLPDVTISGSNFTSGFGGPKGYSHVIVSGFPTGWATTYMTGAIGYNDDKSPAIIGEGYMSLSMTLTQGVQYRLKAQSRTFTNAATPTARIRVTTGGTESITTTSSSFVQTDLLFTPTQASVVIRFEVVSPGAGANATYQGRFRELSLELV